MNNYQDINLGVDISFYLYFLLFTTLIVMFFLITRRIVFHFSVRSKNSNQAIFLVRLPKEKGKDEDRSDNLQGLQEEIAKGETVFSSIGGLRAQKGLTAWFFGRNDNFSFEVVSSSNRISFYITAPKNRALYLEQQVHAHYPEASIEEVEDYNIFNPQGNIMAGYLKAQRSFIFPFLDYTEMESDPMNSLINVMSKLESDESIAIQYV
ncbi:MAG: hypothetical protein WCZ12_03970, partial [Patescibacteria group bacterium]